MYMEVCKHRYRRPPAPCTNWLVYERGTALLAIKAQGTTEEAFCTATCKKTPAGAFRLGNSAIRSAKLFVIHGGAAAEIGYASTWARITGGGARGKAKPQRTSLQGGVRRLGLLRA